MPSAAKGLSCEIAYINIGATTLEDILTSSMVSNPKLKRSLVHHVNNSKFNEFLYLIIRTYLLKQNMCHQDIPLWREQVHCYITHNPYLSKLNMCLQDIPLWREQVHCCPHLTQISLHVCSQLRLEYHRHG